SEAAKIERGSARAVMGPACERRTRRLDPPHHRSVLAVEDQTPRPVDSSLQGIPTAAEDPAVEARAEEGRAIRSRRGAAGSPSGHSCAAVDDEVAAVTPSWF